MCDCTTAGKFRGKHIGKSLLQYALNNSFAYGMKKCLFYTEKGNISEFVYSKCGFEKLCDIYLFEPTLKGWEYLIGI